MGSVGRQLAEFAAGVRWDHLPAPALELVKSAVLDCTGVALAGSRQVSTRAVASLVRADGGRPAATVVGQRFRAPEAAAALVNGTAAHADLFDDNNAPMIAHPSACVVPAILALAEARGASGAEVIAAYAAGFEVEVKLGRWLNPAHYEAGWHATSVLGTVGAAAAAARLIGLDPDRTLMALGIAASSAAGIRRNFGTMTMGFHAGRAARDGLTAALLAERGVRADVDALDGRYGFGPLFTGRDPGPLPSAPGDPLELTASGIIFKPYPSGAPTHAAIDAAITLQAEHAVHADEVEEVVCEVHPWNFKTLRSAAPRDGLGGKVSIEYCLTRALLDGAVALDHFTDAAVVEPRVTDLMARVRVVPGERLPDNGEFPARVTLRLGGGRRLVRQVDNPPGSPSRPPGWSGLEEKFRGCARGVLETGTERAYIARVKDLEAERDVAQLCRMLEGYGQHE